VDFFIAGVGTGGTLTGTGRYLKEKNPNIQVVALEPADSPLLSKGVAGHHGIQGIGANFVPSVLDRQLIDLVLTATTEEAFQAARLLAAKEGILCGISSGTNVAAAIKLAKKLGKGKTVVTILPDTAERYFSTPLFD
jgi:cysteine synthase A